MLSDMHATKNLVTFHQSGIFETPNSLEYSHFIEYEVHTRLIKQMQRHKKSIYYYIHERITYVPVICARIIMSLSTSTPLFNGSHAKENFWALSKAFLISM